MRLKDIVTSNKLGSIMYAEGHFSHDKLAGLPSDNWRADPKFAPAAGMTGMGVHLTDLMIWLFGPVDRVFVTTAKRVLDFKTGDVVTASLQHYSGLSTQITAILKQLITKGLLFGEKTVGLNWLIAPIQIHQTFFHENSYE